MTTAIHKNLTGADLHEPKGADTATSGCVYVSNGSGSGSWQSASTVVTNQAFSTGDTKTTYKTVADSTWIMMDNGTIGDGSSGATTRANADTAALFTLLWAFAACTISGGKGANAAADFAAHKAILLPQVVGTFPQIGGTMAATGGASTVTLVTGNLPAYTPAGTISTSILQGGVYPSLLAILSGGTNVGLGGTSTGGTSISLNNLLSATSVFTGTAQGGTSTPFSIVPKFCSMNMMLKL